MSNHIATAGLYGQHTGRRVGTAHLYTEADVRRHEEGCRRTGMRCDIRRRTPPVAQPETAK